MPTYTYQCRQCGARFKKVVAVVQREEPQSCVCGSQGQWMLPSTCSFTFQQPSTGGLPPNSGVTSVDQEIDRIIGQDAQEKWAVIDQREAHKREILRESPKHSNADLSMNPDGSFRVMDSQEKQSKNSMRVLFETAVEQAKTQ